MRRSLLIVLGGLLAGAAVFLGGYFLADRVCTLRAARATDDLEWLRMEFHLSGSEMARIRQLHEGYLPICQGYCDRIAAGKSELDQTLAAGTDVTAGAEQKLAEIAALRAQCQAAMLRHFAQVSHVMPPAEGRRYLAQMQRLTLGFHEQIENSMSPRGPAQHGQH